jgi:protein involved in ribonucleotide reduction
MDNFNEILKENRERYIERLKEQKRRIKKEQRKEMIIITIAGTFILLLTFKVMSDMSNDAIKKCMKKGYSHQICEYRVG